MQPLITICARKGSKGLPGKNTKFFNGKPLINWTIETALDWGAGPIVVSSDDPAVRDIFGEYMSGNIFFDERPAKLARDDTPKLEVLRHILYKWGGLSPYIVDLDPTNPCRTVGDLADGNEIFEDSLCKTLISVIEAKKNPYMNQLVFSNGTFVLPCQLPAIITQRQDAPIVWDVNSNIYFYDAQWLLRDTKNSCVTNKTDVFLMPDYAFCDIDNEVDFEIAEFLHRKYYLRGK